MAAKVESARRNSSTPIAGQRASKRLWGLFHAKMAGGRLVSNEHWGKPNSTWPGGLWWEHLKLLGRKPMTAGWKGKKATPWRPAHELIHISLPAHIQDAFRLHCGHSDLTAWAAAATIDDVHRLAVQVQSHLFSSFKVEELRDMDDDARDITFENTILYNRDALLYVEFVHAIKFGDIGRAVNVLNMWLVMMRGTSVMPKYADAIFEMLHDLKTCDPLLR